MDHRRCAAAGSGPLFKTGNHSKHGCGNRFELPFDLKEIKETRVACTNKGAPTLMLFNSSNDRSGLDYQDKQLCLR